MLRLLSSVARRTLLAVSVLLLFGLGWIGVSGAIKYSAESETPGQVAQLVSQFAFGPLAVLVVVTGLWARRWNSVVLRLWIGTVALAGGLAPVVWDDDTSVSIGLVAGGAALLLAWVIVFGLRVGARGLTRA